MSTYDRWVPFGFLPQSDVEIGRNSITLLQHSFCVGSIRISASQPSSDIPSGIWATTHQYWRRSCFGIPSDFRRLSLWIWCWTIASSSSLGPSFRTSARFWTMSIVFSIFHSLHKKERPPNAVLPPHTRASYFFFVSGEALIPYLCRMKNGFLNALRSYYPVYRIFKNPFIGQTLQLADVQQLLFFTNRQSLSHYSFLMVRNLILDIQSRDHHNNPWPIYHIVAYLAINRLTDAGCHVLLVVVTKPFRFR